MKVLICGSRNWTDVNAIREYLLGALETYQTPLCLIEGGAPGADLLARKVAEELGVPVMEFPANWEYYHKAAGPIRNRWMAHFGQPDLVVAFHGNLDKSRGTKNMVALAKKSGIPVLLKGRKR